jgi:hypothetical protein
LGPEEVCYDTAREIEVARSRVFVEFWQFLKQEKKFWLAPLIFVLLILSLPDDLRSRASLDLSSTRCFESIGTRSLKRSSTHRVTTAPGFFVF